MGRRDRDGSCWIEEGWRWGELDGTSNRAPRASPSRIRIAGSGVIDRPTFRIQGSQMRAYLGWEKPLTPHKMVEMPLGGSRSL